MTGIQPANRKLLDDALAASLYQPKGSYQPAGSYLTTATYAAEKGAASGIATLGADGKVPGAQLPAAAAGPVVARLSTAFTFSTVATVDVTGLAVDLSTGVWLIEGAGSLYSGTGTADLTLTPALGLVIPAHPGGTSPSTANGGRFERQYGASFSNNTTVWTATGTANPVASTSASGSFQPFRFRGVVTVTTAGRLQARATLANAGNSYVDAYTELKATKLS